MNNEMTTEYMSNEEVIEVLKGLVFGSFDRTTRKERQALDLAIKALEERPQGEWHCSICNESVKDMPTAMGIATFNFCPNCGAKMKDNTKQ